MDAKQVDVMVADASHEVYVDKILDTIREAAKVRGTGIAERTHEYVTTKMKEVQAGDQKEKRSQPQDHNVEFGGLEFFHPDSSLKDNSFL